MKTNIKILVAVLAAIQTMLFIPSCGDTPQHAVFDYQSELTRLEGIWTENSVSYEVTLTFEDDQNGSKRIAKAEFTAPENLCGITFERQDDKTFMTAGEMEVPLEFARPQTFERLERLFSLDEADITEIKTEDSMTVVISSTENWRVETDSEGMFKKILLSDGTNTYTFEKK